MFEPAIAPVRPRVASPVTGDSVLLEDEVLDFLERRQTGVIVLCGERDSGKTTAIRHLAAVLPSGNSVLLVDNGEADVMPDVPDGGIAVCAHRTSPPWKLLAELRLQPWEQDEWIEYLLAVHPADCSHVVQRLSDVEFPAGCPRLWRIVLDTLASDRALSNVRAAVDHFLAAVLPTPDLRRSAAEFCLQTMFDEMQANASLQFLRTCGLSPEAEPVLLHHAIRVLLGAESVVNDIVAGKQPETLHRRLPREIAEAAGRSLAGETKVLSGLERLLMRRLAAKTHAMAASLLRFANPQWKPKSLAKGLKLRGAYLNVVDWRGAPLRKADLTDTDFSGATLEEANLEEAALSRAIFREANLQRASLTNSDGDDIDFTGANLTRAVLNGAEMNGADFVDADLTRARLVGTSLVAVDLTRAKLNVANLAKADLHIARLEETDLTDAVFDKAVLVNVDLRTVIVERTSFRGSRLFGANLEEVNWPDAQLAEANLREAHLTGSTLHRADLRKADLTGTMLGEIDWEGADLREADLRGAGFHMGSSREGLLSSPFASEGTRTGFYTDEYTEQHYKPPEEIRKANLRGCDLRGANIEGVDFYLVDLRDALLDAQQLSYVESCGAILTSEE